MTPEVQAARHAIGSPFVHEQCLASDPGPGAWVRELERNVLPDMQARERADAAVSIWGDGSIRSVSAQRALRNNTYDQRSLGALTSNPFGAVGFGFGQVVSDDPEMQLAIGETFANAGNLFSLAPLGHETRAREMSELLDGPALLGELAPRSRGYEDHKRQAHDERTARKAAALDATPRDHGHARHGAHTTYEQQARRVETGIAPDGAYAETRRASRFESNEAQLEAVGRSRRVLQERGPNTYQETQDGQFEPARFRNVVGGRPGGYGSGAQARRSADGRLIRPVSAEPTGPDPNARVVHRFDPTTEDWTVLSSFPTNDPVTQ